MSSLQDMIGAIRTSEGSQTLDAKFVYVTHEKQVLRFYLVCQIEYKRGGKKNWYDVLKGRKTIYDK